MEPFAVIGGPGQTPAWWQELAAAKIVCIGACTLAESAERRRRQRAVPVADRPDARAGRRAPRSSSSASSSSARTAEFAGDDALQGAGPRRSAAIQAETETGEYTGARRRVRAAARRTSTAREIAARRRTSSTPPTRPQIATDGDRAHEGGGRHDDHLQRRPADPAVHHRGGDRRRTTSPSGSSARTVLADTTIFGRTFDQQQWAHAIGLSLPTARADRELERLVHVVRVVLRQGRRR